MSAGKVQVYVDLMSQPSRAVTWFCRLAGVPHELRITSLAKGENRTPEFEKLNPLCKVPVVVDDGLAITESHTILRYLADKHHAEQWYPHGLRERLAVDQYLDWHHMGLRMPLAKLVWTKFLAPIRTGKPASEAEIQVAERDCAIALKTFERVWLKNGTYVAGSAPTIADLSCVNEIYQLQLVDYKFASVPRVAEYMARMAQLPHYDDIVTVLVKVAAKRKANL